MSTPPDPGSAAVLGQEELRRRVEELAARAPGPHRPLRTDGQWWYLPDPRMPELAHGWKLHLSARPEGFAALLDTVLPILLGRVCDVKFAVSATALGELNSGRHGAAAVGKAVTVYPRPEEVRALGLELAQALAGREGPAVVSDRPVRPDAPVHYRYGPFRVTDDEAQAGMAGPDGSLFPGLAEARYRRPPWADDPFEAADAPARPATTRVGAAATGSPPASPGRPAATSTARSNSPPGARWWSSRPGPSSPRTARAPTRAAGCGTSSGCSTRWPGSPACPHWSTTSGTAPTSTWSVPPAAGSTCAARCSPPARTTPTPVPVPGQRADGTGGRWRAGCCTCWTRCTPAAWWSATSSPPTWCSTRTAGPRWSTSA